MNKLGWHRKYEIIVIDREKFRYNFFNKINKTNLKYEKRKENNFGFSRRHWSLE